MVLSKSGFWLRLEPELDQAADGYRRTEWIMCTVTVIPVTVIFANQSQTIARTAPEAMIRRRRN
jgi:hypothetical protein